MEAMELRCRRAVTLRKLPVLRSTAMHDQTINFLETTVIFLLLTNAVSIIAAAYAISLVQKARPAMVPVTRRPGGMIGLGRDR
jgi:hypothetical protein